MMKMKLKTKLALFWLITICIFGGRGSFSFFPQESEYMEEQLIPLGIANMQTGIEGISSEEIETWLNPQKNDRHAIFESLSHLEKVTYQAEWV